MSTFNLFNKKKLDTIIYNYLESIAATLESIDSRKWSSQQETTEYVTLLINRQEISLKQDTEAEVNMTLYKKIAEVSKIN